MARAGRVEVKVFKPFWGVLFTGMLLAAAYWYLKDNDLRAVYFAVLAIYCLIAEKLDR